MRTLGLLLVVAGLVALVNKGFTYPKTTTLIDAGSIQASFTHDKHVYLEPLVGVCAVAGGIFILMLGRKPQNG